MGECSECEPQGCHPQAKLGGALKTPNQDRVCGGLALCGVQKRSFCPGKIGTEGLLKKVFSCHSERSEESDSRGNFTQELQILRPDESGLRMTC